MLFQKYCLKTNTDTGFEVGLMDVYTEFSEKVVEKYRIGKFKTRVRPGAVKLGDDNNW